MRRFLVFGFCLLALPWLVSPVSAQYKSGAISFSLLLGGHVTDMSGLFSQDGILESRSYDVVPRESGLVALEYNLVPWLGIEAFLGKAGFLKPNNFDMPLWKNYTFDYWYLMGNLVLHLAPQKTVVPYLTGGVGGIFIRPQEGGVNTQLGIDFGAGLDVFVNENWVVRVDARFFNYRFSAADFDKVTLETSGLDPTLNERMWNFFIGGGIRYRF